MFSATATTTGVSVAEGYATGSGQTRGRSQTLKPVREWRHTAYYSLDECMHLAQLKIRNLPDQTAIVKRRGERTELVKTIVVTPIIMAQRITERFRRSAAAKSPFVAQLSVAKAQVDGRLVQIAHRSGRAVGADETFWHEES